MAGRLEKRDAEAKEAGGIVAMNQKPESKTSCFFSGAVL
jgi:hypothetical protein